MKDKFPGARDPRLLDTQLGLGLILVIVDLPLALAILASANR